MKNWIFEATVIVLIVANSVLLAFYDYVDEDAEVNQICKSPVIF